MRWRNPQDVKTILVLGLPESQGQAIRMFLLSIIYRSRVAVHPIQKSMIDNWSGGKAFWSYSSPICLWGLKSECCYRLNVAHKLKSWNLLDIDILEGSKPCLWPKSFILTSFHTSSTPAILTCFVFPEKSHLFLTFAFPHSVPGIKMPIHIFLSESYKTNSIAILSLKFPLYLPSCKSSLSLLILWYRLS